MKRVLRLILFLTLLSGMFINLWSQPEISPFGESTRNPKGTYFTKVIASHTPGFREDILWSQMTPVGSLIASQEFEATNSEYNCQGADDFIVSGGPWTVSTVKFIGGYWNGTGPAQGFNIYFYENSNQQPGNLIVQFNNQTYTLNVNEYTVTLPNPQVFAVGHYWISIQARMDFDLGGQYGWQPHDLPQVELERYWINPGGGFGYGTNWQPGSTVWPGSPERDLCFQLEGMTTINNYPYFENFESGQQGWTSGAISGVDHWQLGTPAQTNINNAHSGTNAWMTRLAANYDNSANTWLMSPEFDFTDLSDPFFSVWLNLYCEFSWDGMILESSIDGGATWQHVRSDDTAPLEFYNNSTTAGPIPPPKWSGQLGVWTEYATAIPELANESSVYLRFRFGSDTSVTYEGVAVDDVAIYNWPTTITDFPYTEDFENGAQGWTSGAIAGVDHWQLGTPAQTNINTAHSGTNAWMTRLTSNYDNNANTWLMSPEFDFTTISTPYFSAWLNLYCENSWDGMILESSVDGGVTWQHVRSDDTAPFEFYNNSSTSGPIPPPKWSGLSGVWTEYSTAIPELANESSVYFRFRFGSDSSVIYEGVAVDDIMIYDLIPGTIEGTVTLNGGSGNVTNVTVTAGGVSVHPSANGSYSISLYWGTYHVTASLVGYESQTMQNVEVLGGETTTGINLTLNNVEVAVNPMSILEYMLPTMPPVTIPLTITNNGAGVLSYNISSSYQQNRRENHSLSLSKRQFITKSGSYDRDYNLRAPQITIDLPDSNVNSRDLFDLLYHFPCYSNGGEFGVVTDGNYIYGARWNVALFYKYELDGTYIGSFSVPGVTNGVLDIAYDGEYFFAVAYTGSFSNVIYKIDLANATLISSFTTVGSNVGIAYDADNDGFWVTSDFGSPLRLVDRTGALMQTLNTTVTNITSLGWDSITEGGPYIWAYTQTGTIYNNLIQIDMNSGNPLQSYDLASLGIITIGNQSGGFNITNQLVPGFWTFLGLVQNDLIWVMELAEDFPPWLAVNPLSGTVPAGESVVIDVTLNSQGLDYGIYTADILINSNAQTAPVTIPVSLHVVTQSTNPNSAQNPIPSHEATNVPMNTPIGWTYTAHSAFTDPIGYRVNMWTGDTSGDPYQAYVAGGPGTYYFHDHPFAFDYNTTYFWQVIPTTEPAGGRSTAEIGTRGGQRDHSLRGDAENCPIWTFITGEETSVEIMDIPWATELKGNYPNPFNPETNIRFNLQTPEFVTLEVLNIRGQRVKTLISEFKEAGQYEIVWNGRDKNNREVASGIYLYRMKSGEYSAVRKMILMK